MKKSNDQKMMTNKLIEKVFTELNKPKDYSGQLTFEPIHNYGTWTGGLYTQPVILGTEHGFTYNIAEAGTIQLNTPTIQPELPSHSHAYTNFVEKIYTSFKKETK